MSLRKNLYIPSVDAKDLYIANNFFKPVEGGYKLTRKDGTANLNKYINSFDYSLDLIDLRNLAQWIYPRGESLSFWHKGKEYSSKIINVTFKYSIRQYNRISSDIYVKYGHNVGGGDLVDGKCIVDNELLALQLDTPMDEQVPTDCLPKYFVERCENSKYIYSLKGTIPSLYSAKTLRKELYKNGFTCDGIKYTRFKRSSGSARVGKVLFIDERLYSGMHISEQCGLDVKEGDPLDIAAFEAYIALPSSSIVDTLRIDPKNILVVSDYESTFKENAVCTSLTPDDHLMTEEKEMTINNSIWDGQSLIDVSLMGKYKEKGMVLLRNKFFKSCCFNTNIQQFFADNGITSVEQLNGETIATDIADIKLITTPSSIKFYKFGKLQTWLDNIFENFGVVKYDKDTHYFDGKMVQAHYQLLNTLQLSAEEVDAIVKPGLDYLSQINTDTDVMRYHIKCRVGENYEPTNVMKDKNEMVYTLLNYRCGFENTKVYYDFKKDLCRSYKKNMRKGHILVNGNYSTLFGNPLEMLKHSIGKFDGTSSLAVGTVHNKRFEYGADILGCRSPHVTIGNILITKNVANEEIDKYFNLTDKIICINSINENVLERLSGADFDSDTALITDNAIMIAAAKKYYDLFKVPTRAVESSKSKRFYTREHLADLDFKTGTNKIGEIVNLSQELNSLLWNKVKAMGGNAREHFDEIKQIYYDVCQLDVMSNIEIDKAKKEFTVNNGNELNIIRDRYKEELVAEDGERKNMPKFLGYIAKTKGYYNPEAKDYINYDTTMDYLLKSINKFRSSKSNGSDFVGLAEIFKSDDYNENSVKWSQISKIYEQTEATANYIKAIATKTEIDGEERHILITCAKEELVFDINQMKINTSTMYQLLKRLDNDKYSAIRNLLFNTLFNYKNDTLIEMLRTKEIIRDEIAPSPHGNYEFYGIKYEKRSEN